MGKTGADCALIPTLALGFPLPCQARYLQSADSLLAIAETPSNVSTL